LGVNPADENAHTGQPGGMSSPSFHPLPPNPTHSLTFFHPLLRLLQFNLSTTLRPPTRSIPESTLVERPALRTSELNPRTLLEVLNVSSAPLSCASAPPNRQLTRTCSRFQTTRTTSPLTRLTTRTLLAPLAELEMTVLRALTTTEVSFSKRASSSNWPY
jgi:hypothetical protein